MRPGESKGATSPGPAGAETRTKAIEMTGISKRYPGTVALDHVDFDLYPGEIKALLGENGAGKSTLIKILSGAVLKDEGTIAISGKPVRINSPQDARQHGIGVIYQEFTLVPALSVAENIFLGRLPGSGLKVDWKSVYRRAQEVMNRLNADIDVRRKVSSLGLAGQQLVEIAKALSTEARILIMDEPTAALSKAETDLLFSVIRRIKSQGVSLVFVSHRLEEIFEIADSVTILRDGVKVAEEPIVTVTPKRLVELMIGRVLSEQLYHRDKVRGPLLLRMSKGRKGEALRDIDLAVHAGEVVGVTGLVGAGQTPLAQCLFGMESLDSGEIQVEGIVTRLESPTQAIGKGIGLIPEDRRRQGLILGLPIRSNVTLAALRQVTRLFRLDRKKELELSKASIESLRIRATGADQVVGSLSGGNQQKVVIAKWTVNKSRILIFHEPTRGIDVGAKEEIYRMMQDLASGGAGILVISSDIQEVMGVSDRIYVMRKGRIAAELDARKSTKEEVLILAAVSG
jgi:ribose transport system ATP-binding protein